MRQVCGFPGSHREGPRRADELASPSGTPLLEATHHAGAVVRFAGAEIGGVLRAGGQARGASLAASSRTAVSRRFDGRVTDRDGLRGASDARRRRVGIDRTSGLDQRGALRARLQVEIGWWLIGLDRLDAALCVLEAIPRLTVAVPLTPRLPARLPVGGRDPRIEVESIAVLESHRPLVQHLDARAAPRGASDQTRERGGQQAVSRHRGHGSVSVDPLLAERAARRPRSQGRPSRVQIRVTVAPRVVWTRPCSPGWSRQSGR